MELLESVKIEKYPEAKDYNLTDVSTAKNGSIANYKTNEQTLITTSKLTSWPLVSVLSFTSGGPEFHF